MGNTTEPGRVTYRVLLSDGSYSHVEIGVDLPLEKGESVETGMDRARNEVRRRIRADFRKMGSLKGWETDEETPSETGSSA